jgi:hypothetical protein
VRVAGLKVGTLEGFVRVGRLWSAVPCGDDMLRSTFEISVRL